MKNIILKYRTMLMSENYERHKGSLLPYFVDEENLDRITGKGIKFLDIDYASEDRAIWAPYSHIARVEQLLLSKNEKVKPLCVELLKFWFENDFKCPNWWYNQIGVPMILADIATLMYGELDEQMQVAMLGRIARGVVDEKTDRSRGIYTGANLLWFSSTTMIYALMTEDSKLLRFITELAANETREGFEGLQSDNSFFQHGPRLYSAGYGRSFVTSIVPMIHILDGTEYQFPKYACDNLARHILDGLRYMMHRGYYDYVSVGREYVRKNGLSARSLLRSAKILCDLKNFDRRDELSRLVESIEKAEPSFSGVKYFPVAALLTMSLDGVYLSYKGTTPKIFDAEIINDENRLGYNLSYGTHTAVMQSGKEYNDIAPLWDYSEIPGTTAPYMTDDELLAVPNFSKRAIDTDDFGGWQDGDVGAIYLTTIHEGISVTTAAFATPYGLVVMGNSIKDEQSRVLRTTVEQCHALFSVEQSREDVIHGSVRYRSLDVNAPIKHNVENRLGNWNRNRPSEPDTPVEGKILTVSVCQKESYDKYAYVIAPTSINLAGLKVVKNELREQSIELPDGRIIVARK